MKSFQQNTQTHTHIKQNTPKPSRENERQLLLYRTNTPILLFFSSSFPSLHLSFVRRFLSAAVPATAPDTNAGFLLVRADPLSRNLAIEILFFSFSFSLFIFFPFGEKRKSKHKSMLTISRLAIQPVTRLQKTQGGIPKNSPKEKQKRKKKNSSHVYHTKCVSSPSCRSLRFFFLSCPFEILLLSEKRRKSKSI